MAGNIVAKQETDTSLFIGATMTEVIRSCKVPVVLGRQDGLNGVEPIARMLGTDACGADI